MIYRSFLDSKAHPPRTSTFDVFQEPRPREIASISSPDLSHLPIVPPPIFSFLYFFSLFLFLLFFSYFSLMDPALPKRIAIHLFAGTVDDCVSFEA